MTRKRKRAQVSESPHASDGQLETSQESTDLTLTPEAASPQYLYEEQNMRQEPKRIPWLCEEHADIVYKERLRSNNDVFTTLRDSTAQIRLLKLDPTSTEEKISGSLETWDKLSLPAFNAISYVCGDALPRNTICINGKDFHVGDNCFYALSQVCLHYPGSYVWIDAICINQQHLAEKSAQVSIMGGIYRLSSRVLACIGPSDEASDIVAQATQDPDSFVQASLPEWGEPFEAWIPQHFWRPPYWNPPMDEASTGMFFDHFRAFKCRPYFNRVWIIQELSGGKGCTTVLCGRYKIDWIALSALSKRISTISMNDAPYRFESATPPDGIPIFALNEVATSFDSPEFPFPDYFVDLTGRGCEDPRDRFFATIDLIDWQRFGQARPVPDYRITPLELSFDLLHKTVSPKLRHVDYITDALELRFDQKALSDIGTMKARCSTQRWYMTWVFGVHEVEQDARGRLKVNLQHLTNGVTGTGVPLYFDGPEYHPALLAANGVVPLYTDGKASVLVSACVRAGDVLVLANQTVLLVRCSEGQSRLSVIGAAVKAGKYKTSSRPQGCLYWKQVKAGIGESLIQLELQDSIALASAIARPGEFSRHVSSRVFSYLSRHAIGTVMANSGWGSPPTSHKKGKYTLRNVSTIHAQRQSCTSCKNGCNPIWYILWCSLYNSNDGVVRFAH